MAKTPACCTRLRNRMAAARGELTRLARLEAYHSQQGHDVSRFPAMLRSQKAEIARIKESIEDHDGEHAGSFKVDEHGKRALPALTPSMDISDRWYQR